MHNFDTFSISQVRPVDIRLVSYSVITLWHDIILSDEDHSSCSAGGGWGKMPLFHRFLTIFTNYKIVELHPLRVAFPVNQFFSKNSYV